MRFSRPKSSEPEINLIPFIDVLLVVLIFLMLTTTYGRLTQLDLRLPQADTAPQQIKKTNHSSFKKIVQSTNEKLFEKIGTSKSFVHSSFQKFIKKKCSFVVIVLSLQQKKSFVLFAAIGFRV